MSKEKVGGFTEVSREKSINYSTLSKLPSNTPTVGSEYTADETTHASRNSKSVLISIGCVKIGADVIVPEVGPPTR